MLRCADAREIAEVFHPALSAGACLTGGWSTTSSGRAFRGTACGLRRGAAREPRENTAGARSAAPSLLTARSRASGLVRRPDDEDDLMAPLWIGYARVSTDEQDLTAQRDALTGLGVSAERIYVDHGLMGTKATGPPARQPISTATGGPPRRSPPRRRAQDRGARRAVWRRALDRLPRHPARPATPGRREVSYCRRAGSRSASGTTSPSSSSASRSAGAAPVAHARIEVGQDGADRGFTRADSTSSPAKPRIASRDAQRVTTTSSVRPRSSSTRSSRPSTKPSVTSSCEDSTLEVRHVGVRVCGAVGPAPSWASDHGVMFASASTQWPRRSNASRR